MSLLHLNVCFEQAASKPLVESWAQSALNWKLASSLGKFKSYAEPCQVLWQCMAGCFNSSLELKAAFGCLWRLLQPLP